MEDAIRTAGRRHARHHASSAAPATRSTSTTSRVVNPQASRSIIVLVPRGGGPDAQVIKTMLALTRGPYRREEPYHIVAEIQDPKNLEAARMVGGDEAVIVDKGRDDLRA